MVKLFTVRRFNSTFVAGAKVNGMVPRVPAQSVASLDEVWRSLPESLGAYPLRYVEDFVVKSNRNGRKLSKCPAGSNFSPAAKVSDGLYECE